MGGDESDLSTTKETSANKILFHLFSKLELSLLVTVLGEYEFSQAESVCAGISLYLGGEQISPQGSEKSQN